METFKPLIFKFIVLFFIAVISHTYVSGESDECSSGHYCYNKSTRKYECCEDSEESSEEDDCPCCEYCLNEDEEYHCCKVHEGKCPKVRRRNSQFAFVSMAPVICKSDEDCDEDEKCCFDSGAREKICKKAED